MCRVAMLSAVWRIAHAKWTDESKLAARNFELRPLADGTRRVPATLVSCC